MADDHLEGVYRIMLRLAWRETVLDQTGKLWDRYHDTGTAEITRLAVAGYPDLPERRREKIAGYCGRTIELTGVGNVRCMKGGTPEERQWSRAWK